MMKTFVQILGEDAPVFRRYLWMAVFYGVLSGLTITALVPVLTRLLNGDGAGAALWLVLLCAGVLACWFLRRQVEKAGIDVGIAVFQGARHRIGDHVANLPIGWFSPENTAKLNHVITHGMMEVAQLPAHVFTPVFSGMVVPVLITVALFLLNWQAGLIALVALPIMIGIFLIAARFGHTADEGFHRNAALTSQRVIEFAQSQAVLRAFNGEGRATRFLEEAIEGQHRSAQRLIWFSILSGVLSSWVIQSVFAAFLLVIVSQLNTGLDRGSIIASIVALLLANRFIEPMLEVAGYGEVLRGARNQLDAIRSILAVKPLRESETPQTPQNRSVQLHDVTFRYAPDQPDVLCGVSLRVESGRMTALIGASGSGKSTIMRLISRFFDVDTGSVLVGGVDVREMSGEALVGQVSQIFQEAYLFQGTIADNIRIGKPDASDTELQEVVRLSRVDEIIARLPEGFNTAVGEGGMRLSGGERQRISIARALLKDAPILLIDEATTALDAENQAAIAETLSRLHGKCTLIVIAHQLSTVQMADEIVVLADGKIAEQGTHEALEARNGLYARFLEQRRAAKGWRIGKAS